LQAQLAVLALRPGPKQMPRRDLQEVLLNWNGPMLRVFYPPPSVLREQLGLDPHASVAVAYAVRIARHLRRAPGEFQRLWQSLRGTGNPHPRDQA
jgi:hypothetical protein